MHLLSLSVLILLVTNSFGQIVPELIVGDHYLPYFTEDQKREQILKPHGRYPNTSEELYPHLYKYTKTDYLGPIKGTPADPANAFNNYAQIGSTKTISNPGYQLPQNIYNPGLSIQQRNQSVIDADMAAYNVNRERSRELVGDAINELNGPTINYNLGIHDGPTVDRFNKAYAELTKMLDESQKIDFLKAVYLVESAVDKTLTWEEFNKMFRDATQIIGALMSKEKLSANDNLAKIMTIYRYMADTTKVYIKSKEKVITSKPMLYDFEDYGGKKDITKVFVSKLLRTGTGQCMSLPTLFYLFAKAFDVNVNLAFAPEHSYITFKDNKGNTQNIELTGRMFTTTDFYMQTGIIKSEQIKSGIYLKPLTEKETIAHLLTTLTISYVRTLGTDERVLDMALTAHKYAPKDLTANMLLAGYQQDLYKNVLRQYEVFRLSQEKFDNDKQVAQIAENLHKAVEHLKKDLGYAKMPDWAYQAWLKSVNELANRQQHVVRRRQLEQQLNK